MTFKVQVLNARPNPMGEQMAQLLSQNNFTTLNAPAITNVALHPKCEEFDDYLSDNQTHWIFISQSAVLFFHDWLKANGMTLNEPVGELFAIGKSTANHLQSLYPNKSISIAKNSDSESLLTFPHLKAAKRTIVVKGRGGRGLIKQVLSSANIDVIELDLYERQATNFESSEVTNWLNCNVILATSVDVGQAVLASATQAFSAQQMQQWQNQSHWIVLSDRIKTFLIQKNIMPDRISVCERSDNAAIIDSIKAITGE